MVKPSGQTATDTKTRILDAADAVFVRRGIDGARMQDIADHAGVNKALLHYHFRSKADLARAVWLRIASSFVPGIFQMIGSDISLDEKIAEALGLGPKELRAFMKRRRAELPALRKRTL